MELKEVAEWLLGKGYMELSKGKPKLTSHFQSAYKSIRIEAESEPVLLAVTLLPVAPLTPIPVPNLGQMAKYKDDDWMKLYMQFIIDAQIPRRVMGSHGDPYDVNKYSEPGKLAFKKALQSGADYGLLTKAVMLAYKSGSRYKKTIGNYMSNGDWRTDYSMLLSKSQQGETGVINHIKDELSDGTRRNYR